MKRLIILPIFSFFLLFYSGCSDSKKQEKPTYKYDYETVENDPYGALIYTLDNGLKIYMSINKEEPRVQTNIAVRAGSKQDPSDATGLAHYLEHMLFKGTSKIGTTNWEEEKELLDKISYLYEQRRKTESPEIRKELYKQIDSLSYEAAQIAIANEYDKMVSSLGAQGTNAYTWLEQTVYVNDVPSNELDKWLMLEAERFSELVLRLFHTELETVYEEFNIGQDSDYRIASKALMENLFQKHNYGQQTTIGKGEHLKNPSMVKIHEYFDTYYVPNNMAIVLAGDIDPDETVDMVKKHFGHYKAKEVPEYKFEEEDEIEEPIVKEVFGQDREFINIAFRGSGSHNNDEALKMRLLANVLSNRKAGLIDLNVNQQQKALNAYARETIVKDYSWLTLGASPKTDQSLDEVKKILLAEIENVKSGNFDDELIDAAIRNMKLRDVRMMEYNFIRASNMTTAFIQDLPWKNTANQYEDMGKITKQDLIDFANNRFGNNYVAVYKKTGSPERHKVEKPKITPLDIEREAKSEFLVNFEKIESPRIEPVFIDYETAIDNSELASGIPFSYIENTTNELFSINFILDMGSASDKEIATAVNYLPYLGTTEYSPEDLQKEFFKLGVSYDVYSSRDKIYVTLSGLEESLEEGIKLMEHVFNEVVENPPAYGELVNDIIKKREDNKLSKGYIMYGGLVNYARYGEDSPIKDILTEDELRLISPEHLVDKIRRIPTYKHRIFYYGTRPSDEAAEIINKYHKVPENLQDYPEEKKFVELETPKNEVYFVDYDMAQTQLTLYSKSKSFDPKLIPYANMFNTYFGSGLSSIIFQEIRETKALAYSAYSYFALPSKKEESHYIRAFVGTQADKLEDATKAMLELMNDMPESEKQYEDSRLSILKQIETNRVTGTSIFWNYETAKNRGLDYDVRKDTYNKIKTMQISDLRSFFDEHIKGNNYKFLVMGSKENVDIGLLKSLGEYKELTLEDVFGY